MSLAPFFADGWFLVSQCLNLPGVEIEPVKDHYAGAMAAVPRAALHLYDMVFEDPVQLAVASQLHGHRTPRFD